MRTETLYLIFIEMTYVIKHLFCDFFNTFELLLSFFKHFFPIIFEYLIGSFFINFAFKFGKFFLNNILEVLVAPHIGLHFEKFWDFRLYNIIPLDLICCYHSLKRILIHHWNNIFYSFIFAKFLIKVI